MPIAIICPDECLRQYVSFFAVWLGASQAQRSMNVLLRLVPAPERHTLSGLRGRVAGAGSLSALSRFGSGVY
jgi:hypothetical protein